MLLFAFMQNGVFSVVRRLSPQAGMAFAVVLVALYGADFAFSMRRALHAAAQNRRTVPRKRSWSDDKAGV